MAGTVRDQKAVFLQEKSVRDLVGDFIIPSYQRGFRWGREEIEELLEDIATAVRGSDKYCLQPIVVKRDNGKFRIIDGQQRLTTLYLIYKYLSTVSDSQATEAAFSLSYDTKKGLGPFLQSIDQTERAEKQQESMDFFFMSKAYDAIEHWFDSNKSASFTEDWDTQVQVIWYEVDDSVDEIALFTRLNKGKIRLTNAELVKASFLCAQHTSGRSRTAKEIAQQWDVMEQELYDDELWYFLTNSADTHYQTRVDLILDLLADKPWGEKREYFTFSYFDKKLSDCPMDERFDVWRSIQHSFLSLKDWFEDHEFYHKIGYLITTGYKSLKEIYAVSGLGLQVGPLSKSAFQAQIDRYIQESLKGVSLGDLDYTDSYEATKRVLLLFNVESIRQKGEGVQRFPFYRYKQEGTWSLEHIHAQHSEWLADKKELKRWMVDHIEPLQMLGGSTEELVARLKAASEDIAFDEESIPELQQEVFTALSAHEGAEHLHTIANLALLNSSHNSALSNSVFSVKRDRIIEMDQRGEYIPYCTLLVFLKYYSPFTASENNFWGAGDREAYLAQMRQVLEAYLPERIEDA